MRILVIALLFLCSTLSACQSSVSVNGMSIIVKSELDKDFSIVYVQCQHAYDKVCAFAQKEGLSIARQGLPSQILFFASPIGVSRATLKPLYSGNAEIVARISLRRGIIFLGRSSEEDLYVELGKWFFYEKDYHWGLDASNDEYHLMIAEKFAKFCLSN